MVSVPALAGLGKLQIAAIAAGVLVVSLVGVVVLGGVGAPAVQGVDNRFGNVTDETTVVHTDLIVHNPNPIGIQLGDTEVAYTVRMNDVEMARGGGTGLDIATGNSTQAFESEMDNEQIPTWWVSHVGNGEHTVVAINATIQTSLLGQRQFDAAQEREVETDIIGEFNSDETRPVRADDPPPAMENPVLYVNETRANWGLVTPERTPIDMEFLLYNPQTIPYTISELGYEITMNGVPVGEGRTEDVAAIPPHSSDTVRTTTEIRNQELDEWWVTHLRNDQVTDLRIEFYAVISSDDLLNDVRVPLDELTYEETIETDIFDNKADDQAATDDTGSYPTPTPGGGPTPTRSGTSTPTQSGFQTPTPTPTASDDGGIGV